MDASPSFDTTLYLSTPDIARFFDLEHPVLLVIEDNGPQGHAAGVPVAISIEVHRAGSMPDSTTASFTLEELIELRNALNEVIVHVERSAA
jgi:hypothetical protein